jgi:hypothetical protein
VEELQLKGYSTLTEDILDLGPVPEDLDEMLALGEFVATGHDNLIVYAEGLGLQKWSS